MERHEFKQFQAQMTASVLSGVQETALIDALTESEGVPSGQRLHIHHNNFRETLSSSLSGIFPTLEAFVGTVFVKGALSEFCIASPPKDAALIGYGSAFAEFLDNHRASEQVPYAADLVRLEWAVHELQLVDEQETSVTSTGEWQLNPNCIIIKSAFPLLSLWSVANGQLPPEAVHLDQGGQTVAVLLTGGEVSLIALSMSESEIVTRLDNAANGDGSLAPVLSSLFEKKIIVPA